MYSILWGARCHLSVPLHPNCGIIVFRSDAYILHAAELTAVLAARTRETTPLFDTASMSQVSPVDHTATYALPSYCTSKVPLSHICQAVQHDERVCVWGIPDLHIVEYAFERGFLATLIDTRKKRKSEPLLNRERPRLYRLQSMDALARASRKVRLRGVVAAGDGDVRSIVLAVFPGYDYVYHYARMVMHVMESCKQIWCCTL